MANQPVNVELGDVVLWYMDRDREATPYPAIVTEAAGAVVSVNVLAADLRNFFVKSGVHHIDDVEANRRDDKDPGGWDYTPRTKRLAMLEAEVAKLKKG